jgi:hypothetical protein
MALQVEEMGADGVWWSPDWRGPEPASLHALRRESKHPSPGTLPALGTEEAGRCSLVAFSTSSYVGFKRARVAMQCQHKSLDP